MIDMNITMLYKSLHKLQYGTNKMLMLRGGVNMILKYERLGSSSAICHQILGNKCSRVVGAGEQERTHPIGGLEKGCTRK